MTVCDDPHLSRLDYAPRRVWLAMNDVGELEEQGRSEYIDAPWDETESYWCHGCDTEIDGENAAVAHVVEARLNRARGV